MHPRCAVGGHCHLADDPRYIAASRAFAFLWRRFGRDRRHDAGDLRQMAWLAACKVYERGHRDEKLSAIAVKQAISEWDKTYGTRSKWVGSTVYEDIGDYQASEPNEFVEYDRPKLLECLPDSRARALELFVVGEMSQATVADVMGIKEASVKAMIGMAKRKIRKMHHDRIIA